MSIAKKLNDYDHAMSWGDKDYSFEYGTIDEIVESMNTKDAIEVVEDFIEAMKRTYPNIAFGHFAQGFCTAERDEDKDKPWGDGKGKRFYCWPSCNACFSEIGDGYGLLDKALKIIKGENNEVLHM